MAIVIQEEKNTGSWFGFSILLMVLVILGVALYYLFFINPEILKNAYSEKISSIEEFSQMQFDPSSVINGEFFQDKKKFIPVTQITNPGNTKPFGIQ